jgi:hypothetical protein
LEEERAKHAASSPLSEFKAQIEGDETINGLKIDVSFDKPTAKRQQ